MAQRSELKVDGDLFAALVSLTAQRPEHAAMCSVLQELPADEVVPADPVVVVAAYVNALAKGYGLSEHADVAENQFDHVAPPREETALFRAVLPEFEDADALRARLYGAIVRLSEDPGARQYLDMRAPVSEVGFRRIAQVYWNLEQTPGRPKLPIRSGQEIVVGGRRARADIASSSGDADLACMPATKRMNTRLTGLGQAPPDATSGQGLRNKGARLAVLIADELIRDAPAPPLASSMTLSIVVGRQGKRQLVLSSGEATSRTAGAATDARPPAPIEPWRPHGRVVLGPVTTVGGAYVRRAVDDELERLWAASGDRRVWLRGGPGHGKSFVARRVLQDAVAHEGDASELLVVWVDSAGPDAVREAFSAVLERVPGLGDVPVDGSDALDARSRRVLEALASSDWRWLVVLDDADATGLIDAGLVPPGTNPLGRVLLTTRVRDSRLTSHGHVVGVDVFTPAESEAVLRGQVDPGTGASAALAGASDSDTTALAAAVGHHPLALSIAAATITANAMEVQDWITEFGTTTHMDTAADEPDPGGYRHLVGSTWRIALERASTGLPAGVVERAATVAALQAPEGHPTWLWSCPAVLTWVMGKTAEDGTRRMPEPVKRLVSHGLLEMRGPAWRTGRLAIHPLAARAVLEVADPSDTTTAAALLADEWLMRCTTGEPAVRAGLRRNVEPLLTAAPPGSATEVTVRVLLSLAQQEARSYATQRERVETVATYLRRGGTSGEAVMAYQLASLAETAEQAGLSEEAHAAYEQVVEFYERVVAQPWADDEQRALQLQQLGEALMKLGREPEARQRLAEAMTLYANVPDVALTLDDLLTLMEMQRALGESAAQTELLRRITEHVDIEVGGDVSQIVLLAERMQRLGLEDQAARLIGDVTARVVDGAAELQPARRRALVWLQASAGRWADALNTLAPVAALADARLDDLVVLAGVLLRLGRSEEAAEVLSRAAQVGARLDAGEADGADVRRSSDDAVVALSLMGAAQHAVGSQDWADAVGLYDALVDFRHSQGTKELRLGEASVAAALVQRARAEVLAGRFDDARSSSTEAANVYRMLSDLAPDDAGLRLELVSAQVIAATAHLLAGRMDAAGDELLRATEGVRAIPDPERSDEHRSDVAAVLEDMGRLGDRVARHDIAGYCYGRLVAMRLADREADESVETLRQLARAETSLGDALRHEERFAEAEPWLRDAVNLWNVVKVDPGDGAARRGLVQALEALAVVHAALGRTDQRVAALRRAVELRREETLEDPGDRQAQLQLAAALATLGAAHAEDGHLDDAVECFGGAVNVADMAAELAGKPRDAAAVSVLGAVLPHLAHALRALRRTDEADAAERRFEELTNDDHPDVETD